MKEDFGVKGQRGELLLGTFEAEEEGVRGWDLCSQSGLCRALCIFGFFCNSVYFLHFVCDHAIELLRLGLTTAYSGPRYPFSFSSLVLV